LVKINKNRPQLTSRGERDSKYKQVMRILFGVPSAQQVRVQPGRITDSSPPYCNSLKCFIQTLVLLLSFPRCSLRIL